VSVAIIIIIRYTEDAIILIKNTYRHIKAIAIIGICLRKTCESCLYGMHNSNTLMTTLSGRKYQACQLFISGFFLWMTKNLSFHRSQYFEAGINN
jgi:hypothetical protein